MNYKIIILSLFIASVTAGQTTQILSLDYNYKKLPYGLTKKVPSANPKVALALSGGGARGLSQIGVLKAFEEFNVIPEIIVGTSMGSIVGGLYSAGYSPEEIDSIAQNTNWNYLLALSNNSNRQDLFIDQKITEDRAVLTLRMKELQPVIPTSINDGQKLSNYLNLLSFHAPIHVKRDFDDLKVKYRAVCTDLVTGDRVVISKGSLSQAMRASSSVSFFLSPVRMDSLILVDGGLVANVPVKIAEEMGSNFIIAVNTTSSLHHEKDLNVPWIVADQIVSIPIRLLNESQLSGADVVIDPIFSNKEADDFTNIDSVIHEGYISTLPSLYLIKSKIDSLFQRNLSADLVDYENLNTALGPEEELFMRKMNSKKTVSNVDILTFMAELYDKGIYKNIDAFVTVYPDSSTLEFKLDYNPLVWKVHLDGITLINKQNADSLLSVLNDKPYNPELLSNILMDLIRMYRSKGFSLAEVRNVSFNETTGVITVTIDEGLISSIILEGNYKTSPTIITREFPIRPGDYFRYSDIEQGLINLRSTGLFDDIVLNVNRRQGENILVLRILERVSSLIRLGVRVDNEDRAQLSLDVRDENLFGSGTELGLLLSVGARNRAYILEQKANRVFESYFTYKINGFYEIHDIFSYEDAPRTRPHYFSRINTGEYREISYGLSASVGTQVMRFGNLILTGKYQKDEVKNIQSSPVTPYKIDIISLKFSSTIDTQDKYPYPEKGFFFTGYYETAQKILGGDVGFTNIGFAYKNIFTLAGRHSFTTSAKMGFADRTLPLSQHYSLGGQENFFGFREDEFVGRQLLIGSLEYRFKMPFRIFFDTYFKLRYDLGSVWKIQEQIKFKDFKHGIGSTLSFDTPVGPADFSVGRSFLFEKNIPGNPINLGDVVFYFSIGYSF